MFWFVKMLGISSVAGELSASREGVCCVETVLILSPNFTRHGQIRTAQIQTERNRSWRTDSVLYQQQQDGISEVRRCNWKRKLNNV
jgi:hypothetical protein